MEMDPMTDPLKIDASLTERLQDYASERGLDLQEALAIALGLGLEVCASESVRLDGRVRTLERRLGDLSATLNALGPAVLGVRALLVGWAAKEAYGVGEDELEAELHATGEAEWALSLAERGIVAPESPATAQEQ
jgi:hypothetical protein